MAQEATDEGVVKYPVNVRHRRTHAFISARLSVRELHARLEASGLRGEIEADIDDPHERACWTGKIHVRGIDGDRTIWTIEDTPDVFRILHYLETFSPSVVKDLCARILALEAQIEDLKGRG